MVTDMKDFYRISYMENFKDLFIISVNTRVTIILCIFYFDNLIYVIGIVFINCIIKVILYNFVSERVAFFGKAYKP